MPNSIANTVFHRCKLYKIFVQMVQCETQSLFTLNTRGDKIMYSGTDQLAVCLFVYLIVRNKIQICIVSIIHYCSNKTLHIVSRAFCGLFKINILSYIHTNTHTDFFPIYFTLIVAFWIARKISLQFIVCMQMYLETAKFHLILFIIFSRYEK